MLRKGPFARLRGTGNLCIPDIVLIPLLSRNLEVKLRSSRGWFLLSDSAMCWGSVSVKQPSASQGKLGALVCIRAHQSVYNISVCLHRGEVPVSHGAEPNITVLT